MEEELVKRAKKWTREAFDSETRKAVQELIQGGGEALLEAFHQDLSFGTGGLRGIMGPGTNRMNAYTVGRATQGFANYLRKAFGEGEHRVAISFDCRHNSAYFAQVCAEVFAANGFEAHLFEELRPTPVLSFAVRHLECVGGVMVTASHNPPEYNGYKVYWKGGAQVTEPHDQGIMDEVSDLHDFASIRREKATSRIRPVGREMDEAYLATMLEHLIDPAAIADQHDLPIVFTSLHGTAVTMLPEALRRSGFTRVLSVKAQEMPDGDFPTVKSPNPEEGAALAMAIEEAKATGAALVLGCDPDADRVGIAVRNRKGEFVLLNGNDTGALLVWYQLFRLKALKRLPVNGYVGKTIVTTELIREIAEGFEVPCYDTLTGFKHIARLIEDREESEKFITGGEESYGYMISDFVRDKDAIAAGVIIAEMAAWAQGKGLDLLDLLQQIHEDFALYREGLVSITMPGIQGAAEIKGLMDRFRADTPTQLAGSSVVVVRDFQTSEEHFVEEHRTEKIDLPASNVMQFDLADGSRVTARPSGTEPKIKFYFSVCDRSKEGSYHDRYQKAEARVEALKEDFRKLMTS